MTSMNASGDSQSLSIKPQLQHCFMAGLRFDTELEYLEEQGRWEPLCSEQDGTSIATAVQKKISLLVRINDLLRDAPQAVPETTVEWQSWLDEAGAQYQAKTLESSLHAMAQPLLKGLSSDGVMLVQLALPIEGKRWMLVTGVECEHSATRPPKLRSLLVFDPQVPGVWACGHNARVALPNNHKSDALGLQHTLCIYRTLDGGYLACTAQRIVAMY
ncbi:hypothetical protein [Lampropedia aestuarii]|uniref:hypothetical protein n=1 Tax=Lampropedia aestuarii TaxID=2562762 RepID=UPI0024691449|nr:hypothetical protein [Lampropedia aestuarii]MDH5859268.1 hypothetical protein [Lampropedia aestuarii]